MIAHLCAPVYGQIPKLMLQASRARGSFIRVPHTESAAHKHRTNRDLPTVDQSRTKPLEISLLQSITKIVEAVGIERDPIFLSPAILRRCNRPPNPSADSADSGVSRSRTLISALQETLVPCSGWPEPSRAVNSASNGPRGLLGWSRIEVLVVRAQGRVPGLVPARAGVVSGPAVGFVVAQTPGRSQPETSVNLHFALSSGCQKKANAWLPPVWVAIYGKLREGKRRSRSVEDFARGTED